MSVAKYKDPATGSWNKVPSAIAGGGEVEIDPTGGLIEGANGLAVKVDASTVKLDDSHKIAVRYYNGLESTSDGLSVKPNTNAGIDVDDNGVALKIADDSLVLSSDGIGVLTKANGGILADGAGLYIDRTVVLEPLFMSQAEYDARTDKDSIWAIITD